MVNLKTKFFIMIIYFKECFDFSDLMILLSDLALDALGSFIYKITVRLGELSNNREPDLSLLQQTIRYVENMLQKNVPPTLANIVSSRLQTSIFQAVVAIFKIFQKSGFSKCQDLQHKMIVEMWLAVIHPSIIFFDFSFETFYNLGKKYCSQFCITFLDEVFAKARHICVVKLELSYLFLREKVFNCLCELKNLVEITFHGCNNAMVIALSEKCCRLKKLDIKTSPLISDKCVPSIIKFHCLEYLDIRDTYISNNGVKDIIKKLTQLRVFNSFLTIPHLSLLEECNPDISSLGFRLIEYGDFLPLTFKNLTSVSISFRYVYGQSFVSLKDSLVELGQKLRELRLDNVDGTDLQFIAVNCPSLNLIGLSFQKTSSLGFPDVFSLDTYSQKYPLPVFHSIQSCEFNLKNCCLIQHILSSFVNVKKVLLHELNKPFCFLFVHILQSMKNDCINELFVKGNRFQLHGNKLLIYKTGGSVTIDSMEKLEDLVTHVVDIKKA